MSKGEGCDWGTNNLIRLTRLLVFLAGFRGVFRGVPTPVLKIVVTLFLKSSLIVKTAVTSISGYSLFIEAKTHKIRIYFL